MSFWQSTAIAQYPPAQGPPTVSGSNIRELPVSLFTSILTATIKDSILPKANNDIKAANPPMEIKLALSSLKLRGPYRTQTEYTDQPNQFIIRIPYNIDFELQINNFPNRHLYENIELIFSCDHWFALAGGNLSASLKADKPYVGGPSITEQILNAFLANFLSPYVENKISANLPAAVRQKISLSGFNTQCNCLGIYGATPPYNFAALQYQFKRSPRTLPSIMNSINVSVSSIKRLPAKNYEQNTILYDSIENIQLELFANQQMKSFNLPGIREGQQLSLPENTIQVNRPAAGSSLVIIANIVQQNFQKDSRFVVYTAADNFGSGTKKLVVKKSFNSPPKRLPNGQMTKPQRIEVDAYEITYIIKVPNREIMEVRPLAPAR